MKLCWSKECWIVFTYLANFWWWLFTPLTDTVNLSCCGPPCGREQVLLITACVTGGFWCVFLTWFASLETLTSTLCVPWYHERFVFAQPDSSQEFSDAKKFYASKTPNNLKRIILKGKRAVSEWEIFRKRRKKIPCTFIIAKTDLTSCFEC